MESFVSQVHELCADLVDDLWNLNSINSWSFTMAQMFHKYVSLCRGFFGVNEAEVQASPEIWYTFHPAEGIGSPNDHLPRKSERPMTCQAVVKSSF